MPFENYARVHMSMVFKYRKPNARELDILRRKRLWLSAPADFDDPSDMSLPIDKLFDASPDVAFRAMVKISLRQNPTQRPVNVLNETSQAMELGGLRRNLQEGFGQKLLDDVRQEAGVISFGATCDNKHLWQKYAENSRGFCIGFETKTLGLKAHPVKYVTRDEKISVQYFEAKPTAIREAACLIKYTEWLAEDEVRIIIPRRARTYFPFTEEAVVKIVVGEAVTASFRRRVHAIAQNEFPNAEFSER